MGCSLQNGRKVNERRWNVHTVKSELLIFIGYFLILTGTIVLEKPFILRTYEKAAAFGYLCDIAMPGNAVFSKFGLSKEPCLEKSSVSSELVRAQNYNTGIYAAQNSNGFVYEDSYTDPEYDAILSGPYGMMCVIEIPSINVLIPVGHGTGTELLRDAAGHMHGTSLPIGGPSTHSVIAAHAGLVDRELFTRLPGIRMGDEFNIYVLGEKHTYRVDRISTCLPSETEALAVTRGADMVTLMTCVPYGINTHRLFVRGVRSLNEKNSSAFDLVIARRREFVRSVLYIAGMFLVTAVQTACYFLHVYNVLSRIRLTRKRSML